MRDVVDVVRRRWTKDPLNPVDGALSDMGQIWCELRLFACHYGVKVINLPRQARDKDSKS